MRESRARAAALAVALAAPALLGTGCGSERQDAHAPSGEFQLDVVGARFPARQTVAQTSVMRLDVANTGDRTVPELAVTVQTDPGHAGAAPTAFGQASQEPGLADPNRPIWIVDRGPFGGDSAYVNTWAVGPLAGGRTRTLRWLLTATRPGRFSVTWRVSPALLGDVSLTGDGRTEGEFRVVVSGAPVASGVGPAGRVVRG
jgi:hypothetical protein